MVKTRKLYKVKYHYNSNTKHVRVNMGLELCTSSDCSLSLYEISTKYFYWVIVQTWKVNKGSNSKTKQDRVIILHSELPLSYYRQAMSITTIILFHLHLGWGGEGEDKMDCIYLVLHVLMSPLYYSVNFPQLLYKNELAVGAFSLLHSKQKNLWNSFLL